jgi:queuine tRNA-ribosyltransferase
MFAGTAAKDDADAQFLHFELQMIPVSSFGFSLRATDGRARLGTMTTPHGTVETPAFMPVGTQGSVKATLHRDLESIGASIILGNTYHLFLRPGDERIARLGGLHAFIGWERPILTDSGGYQVFSLADRRVIRQEGAEFQSHLDGSRHLLTPERATDIQARLGSDIQMVFDECPRTRRPTRTPPAPWSGPPGGRRGAGPGSRRCATPRPTT